MGQQKGRNMVNNKYPNSSELWFFYDDEISIKWDCDKSFTTIPINRNVVVVEKP